MKDLPLKDKIEIAAEQIEQSDEVGCLTAKQLRHILTNFAESLVKNITYEPLLAPVLPKWDCNDCEQYPCAHQQMMNDLNAKLKYNTCGDHSERGTP